MSSTTLFRLSGLALILGALVFAVAVSLTGDATGISQYSDPLFLPARLGGIIGGLLLLIGLPGLYLRQADKTGKLGLVSFVMTFLGIAAHWPLLPILSFASAPLAARPETQSLIAGEGMVEVGPLFTGYFVLSTLILYLGIILLGIATLRARVFPRGAGVLLIVSPPITLIILPIGLGSIAAVLTSAVFVLGFAWCGYALWTGKERQEPTLATNNPNSTPKQSSIEPRPRVK